MREQQMARRYAKALVQAVSDRALEEQFEQQLAVLAKLMSNKTSELLVVMQNPRILMQERVAIIAKIADVLGCHALLKKMLHMLVERDRMPCLPEIYQAFLAEIDARMGRVRARVSSAKELGGDQLTQVTKALEKRLGKSVVSTSYTDRTLLGGIKAQIGGVVFDGSLLSRLANLEKQLVH